MMTVFPHTLLRGAAILALLSGALFALLASPSPAQAFQEKHPLLMIVVSFEGDDGGMPQPYNSSYDWNASLFADAGSLSAYYREMSDSRLEFQPAHETSTFDQAGNVNVADRVDDGIVHVALPQSYHAWGLVNNDQAVAQDFADMVLDAFSAAGAFVDYAAYDANHDNRIEPEELVVAICVPGYDASALSEPNRTDIPVMWPHQGFIDKKSASSGSSNTMSLDSYIAITENLLEEEDGTSTVQQEPLGVVYHEIGHYLGLPDLYALNANPETGAWGAYNVGALSLMGLGAWSITLDDQNGWQYSPTALDAWSRFALGWSEPTLVTSSGDYRVSSQNSEQGYSCLKIPTAEAGQYYLVENRQPIGLDAALAESYEECPEGGLVIWHIDEAVCERYGEENHVNDTDHRPGVMPLCFEFDDSEACFTSWDASKPDSRFPFFSSSTVERFTGNSSTEISLPVYASDPESDSPGNRTESNITLQFPDASADVMTVRVNLPDQLQATLNASAETASDDQGSHSAAAAIPAPRPEALIIIGIAIVVVGFAASALLPRR